MNNILRLGSISYEEVAQTRRMLELPSAAFAALNRTDEDLARIRAVIAREKEVTVDDPIVSELDVDFHVAVAEASKNRVLSAFMSALHRVTHPVSYLQLTPKTGRETVRQHLAILKAIEAGEPDRAREQMERHLDYVESLDRVPNGTRGQG
jgi:GntR family transcriptional regulator, transcriptional repressor for pyruvate dehydrogenase complex